MNEKPWTYGGRSGGVTEAREDFGPALDSIGIGKAQLDAEINVLPGDGETIALAGKNIGTGDKALENGRILSLAGPGQEDTMPSQHGLDGFGVALNDPVSGGMLVRDDDVAVGVGAAEKGDGVMVETVVERSEPFEGTA